MYSDDDNGCSHPLGSPIRKSPDHSLLAAPRGLSQLATSFIAYSRQGIHTHALSSLTIESTLITECTSKRFMQLAVARQYIQFSKIAFPALQKPGVGIREPRSQLPASAFCWFLVGLGRVELPTSPLSGVRSSHLSYRPKTLAGPMRGLPHIWWS